MVKRAITLVAALALMMGLFPGMASANGGPPPHGHMLILGLEFGPEGVTYRKCVDLASNRALPLHAHHEHVHTGKAGEALFTRAGHAAVPTAPYSPFLNCAHLAELFPPAG